MTHAAPTRRGTPHRLLQRMLDPRRPAPRLACQSVLDM
jgi:hypothetical protein